MTDVAGSDSPLVSAVVPTYGRRVDHLRAAVSSIAAQSHEPVELIVVDDSPDDAALEDATFRGGDGPARTDFQRVSWLRRGTHDGAGAARNTGLRAASGEFVAFLDDDDTWYPDKLTRQLARFHRGGLALGLVLTGQQYVADDGTVLATSRPSGEATSLRDILIGRPISPFSTAMVRASVPAEAGDIDETLPVLEDREWFLRIARAYRIGVIPAPLTRRRTGNYTTLSGNFEGIRDRTYPRMLEKHRDLAAEFGPLVERRFVASLSRTVGATGVSAGRYEAARPYLYRSVQAYPLDWKAWAYLFTSFGGDRGRRTASAVRRLVGRIHDALG